MDVNKNTSSEPPGLSTISIESNTDIKQDSKLPTSLINLVSHCLKSHTKLTKTQLSNSEDYTDDRYPMLPLQSTSLKVVDEYNQQMPPELHWDLTGELERFHQSSLNYCKSKHVLIDPCILSLTSLTNTDKIEKKYPSIVKDINNFFAKNIQQSPEYAALMEQFAFYKEFGNSNELTLYQQRICNSFKELPFLYLRLEILRWTLFFENSEKFMECANFRILSLGEKIRTDETRTQEPKIIDVVAAPVKKSSSGFVPSLTLPAIIEPKTTTAPQTKNSPIIDYLDANRSIFNPVVKPRATPGVSSSQEAPLSTESPVLSQESFKKEPAQPCVSSSGHEDVARAAPATPFVPPLSVQPNPLSLLTPKKRVEPAITSPKPQKNVTFPDKPSFVVEVETNENQTETNSLVEHDEVTNELSEEITMETETQPIPIPEYTTELVEAEASNASPVEEVLKPIEEEPKQPEPVTDQQSAPPASTRTGYVPTFLPLTDTRPTFKIKTPVKPAYVEPVSALRSPSSTKLRIQTKTEMDAMEADLHREPLPPLTPPTPKHRKIEIPRDDELNSWIAYYNDGLRLRDFNEYIARKFSVKSSSGGKSMFTTPRPSISDNTFISLFNAFFVTITSFRKDDLKEEDIIRALVKSLGSFEIISTESDVVYFSLLVADLFYPNANIKLTYSRNTKRFKPMKTLVAAVKQSNIPKISTQALLDKLKTKWTE